LDIQLCILLPTPPALNGTKPLDIRKVGLGGRNEETHMSEWPTCKTILPCAGVSDPPCPHYVLLRHIRIRGRKLDTSLVRARACRRKSQTLLDCNSFVQEDSFLLSADRRDRYHCSKCCQRLCEDDNVSEHPGADKVTLTSESENVS